MLSNCTNNFWNGEYKVLFFDKYMGTLNSSVYALYLNHLKKIDVSCTFYTQQNLLKLVNFTYDDQQKDNLLWNSFRISMKI